jgi:hypothetical protein
MLKKYTIYGERCSGTTYLEQIINLNFDIEITWSYGWKHFFGFNDLSNTDDVLFIGIVRNLCDWVNSLYREKYHLKPEITKNTNSFFNNTFYSFYDSNTEIMEDRNIETNKRYKNIFELRHIKNKFLIETMPKLVKNYLIITYDELLDNFSGIMEKIKNCGLIVRSNIDFPLNINYYKSNPNKIFIKKKNEIQDEIIINKANLFYEKILFPNLYNIIIELKFIQKDIINDSIMLYIIKNKLEEIQDKFYNKILNINKNVIVKFIIPSKLLKTRVFTFYKCWRNGYCLNDSTIKIPKNIVKVILKKV